MVQGFEVIVQLLPLLLLTFGVAAAATGILVRFSSHAAVMDLPNERSLHRIPTPRGGGLSIVLAFLLAVAFVVQIATPPLGWQALVVGGLMIACVGWLDDRYSLSAKSRLFIHLLSSGILMFGIYQGRISGDLGLISFGSTTLAIALGTLMAAWFVNFYNFMDGSDGIAAVEAITVGTVWGCLAFSRGELALAGFSWIVASAAAGFMIFNWSPAKIFMGDVASGFLGFCFVGIFLFGDRSGAVPLSAGLILMGCFIVDSGYTLVRRALRGENVAQAHRDHAYQHACQMGFGHKGVALWTLAINLIWLSPLAWCAVQFQQWRYLILVVAYLPLIAIAYRFRAGRELS